MKTLYDFLIDNKEYWDGHIHLFDHNGIIDQEIINSNNKCVCFADIAFRYIDKYKKGDIIKYYDDFIENHYNPSKHVLLATGLNTDDIISIYKKYPQYIKGFGELKCYSEWKGGKLQYGNLMWIKSLLEFDRDLKLPIYIHYNLDTIKKRQEFEELVSNYPEIPIVLCHSGFIDDNNENDIIYQYVLKLLSRYNNLYIDISTCKTREFYLTYFEKLLQIDQNKIIIGSDINPIVKEVIINPRQFSKMCYKQCDSLNKIKNYSDNILKLFKMNTDADKLIKLYQKNFNTFSRHCKIHLLTRGNLIGMYPKKKIKKYLKLNANTLNHVMDLFDNNVEKLLDKYVLIGYTTDKRKKHIAELFKSSDDDYKKFLCIITILEMSYTFKRMDMLYMINTDKIHQILTDNIHLIKSCIINDKYNFRDNASTKYINSIYFIYNLKSTFNELNNILDDDFYNQNIYYFKSLCDKTPNVTTLYGITHILIGLSDFYTRHIPQKYDELLNILYKSLCDDKIFKQLTLDLKVEILLCCKLFGKLINVDVTEYIDFDPKNLENNEHTNMLYILLKKYKIKK